MADLNFHSGPSLEEGVSAVTATPSVGLGTRRYWKGEEYIYCYNAGSNTLAVRLGARPVTAASGYSVSAKSSAAVFNPLVGVVKHVAIPSGEYGWILSRGFATVELVSASTADYKMIALGLNGQFIEASGNTTFGTSVVVGCLLSHNTAASGQAYAFIRGMS